MEIFRFQMTAAAPTKHEFSLPPGAEVVHVGVQRGDPCLWVLGDFDADEDDFEQRTFFVMGTGMSWDAGEFNLWPHGTCTTNVPNSTAGDVMVWHVLEQKPGLDG